MLLFNLIDRLGKRHYERFHKQQNISNEIIEILKSLKTTCIDELEQHLRLSLLASSNLSRLTYKRILETMNNPCSISNLTRLCVQLEKEVEQNNDTLCMANILLVVLKVMQKYNIKTERHQRTLEKQPLLNKAFADNKEKIIYEINQLDDYLSDTPRMQLLWQKINTYKKQLQTPVQEALPSYDELYQFISILQHTLRTIPRLNNQRAETSSDLLEKRITRASRHRLDNQRASLPLTKLELQIMKMMSRSLDNQRASF